MSSPVTPRTVRPRSLTFRRITAGDAYRVHRRRYYLHSYDAASGWQPNRAVPCIDLEQGQLFVNGVHIMAPKITHDHVSWVQRTQGADGAHYSAGVLHLHSNGLEGHGIVAIGTDHGDALSRDVLATVIPSVTYHTQLTSARYPSGTDPGTVPPSDWATGLSLEIGYQQQIGDSVPTPVVKVDGQDVSEQCAWSVTDRYTVLDIALSDSDCVFAPNLYANATLSFDALALNAPGAGVVRKSCADTAPGDGTVQLWKAALQAAPVAAGSPAPRVLPQPVRRMTSQAQLLSTDDDGLTITELMTLLPDDKVADDANAMLVRNMKWAMGQDSQEKEWLTRFFSETPPAITEPDQQQLVQQSLGWYQNQLAMAYLTHSFNSYSGKNEPEHRLDDTQTNTLADYLKTGLARSTDFNVQHKGIYIDAYVGSKTRLADYVNDSTPEVVGWAQGAVVFSRNDTSADLTVPGGVNVTTASGIVFTTQARTTLLMGRATSDPVPIAANQTGPAGVVGADAITEFGDQTAAGIDGVTNPAPTTLSADSGGMKWAIKLFTSLTSGSQFILMVNRVAGAAGDPKALGPVNNLACLLTALEPSGTVASNYFQSILSGVVVKLVPLVVHRDKDTIMQWLPTAMQELLRKLADGELPNEVDISKAEAEEMYQEFMKHQAEVSSGIGDLLTSIAASSLVKQAQVAEEQFPGTLGARFPKLAKAAKFMLALGWIGGVSSVIVALTRGDWKKMTDVQRAEFVTNCVQLGATGFEAVPLIWQGTKSVTLASWNKLNDWWNAPQQQKAIEIERVNTAKDDEALPKSEGENVQELMEESEVTGTLGKGTIFERIFAEGVFSGALKIVGAAAAAAMAAYALWQLIDDIENHGSVSTIVFDSLMFAANLLAAVCLIVDLLVATSWIPIAGAVLAIAGIIIGVIAGYFEQPDNPVDDWMVEHGIPFVNGLPAQTPSAATVNFAAVPA